MMAILLGHDAIPKSAFPNSDRILTRPALDCFGGVADRKFRDSRSIAARFGLRIMSWWYAEVTGSRRWKAYGLMDVVSRCESGRVMQSWGLWTVGGAGHLTEC
jgi:hypothetical protein